MKNYIKPSIKVSMFSDERVSTTENTGVDIDSLAKLTANGLQNNIANTQNVIQKSIRMKDVMQFNQ